MNAALTTLSISEITKRCFGTLLPKTLVCRNHSAWFCAHGDGVGGTTFMFFEPLGKMILTSSISASHAFPHQLPLIPARKPVLPPPGSKPLINPLTLVIFLMCQQDYSLLLQCGFQEGNWSHRRGCFCRLPAVFFVGEEDFPNSQHWVPEFRFSQKEHHNCLLAPIRQHASQAGGVVGEEERLSSVLIDLLLRQTCKLSFPVEWTRTNCFHAV